MYKDAAPIGGPVDLSKLKTVGYLNNFKKSSHAVGYRLVNQDLHNHHIVPKQWAKSLLVGKPGMPTSTSDPAWNAILDDMPGLLMDAKSHVGSGVGIENGTASFHAILNSPEHLLQNGNYDSTTILQELGAAYAEWDPDLGPHVWEAAKEWLATKGVTP
jgi:hypothetical protein